MSLINGINVIGYFYENGQWYPGVCARSMSIQVNVETVETTTSGSGIWKTVVPTKNSWGFTNEGLCALSVAGGLTIADIESRMRAHTQMLFRFQMTAQDKSVYTDQGYCYLTGATKVGSFDNVSTWNTSADGNGALTQVFTPIVQPIPLMYRYEKQPGLGTFGFTDAALIGKDIQVVTRGNSVSQHLVTGAPGTEEVQYVSATGQFVWAQEFDTAEWVTINYQNL